MEGRGYTDLRRNINEEIIMKSRAESSIKVPMSNMEMANFKSHFQTYRTDSEELFKSWITSEENHSFNSSSPFQRAPQAIGRMARETNYVNHVDEENSANLDQNSFRNVVERGVQASNPHLDKAWFHSSRPMTRSRSSELKRSLATQNFQVHDISGSDINILNQMGTYMRNFNEKRDIEDGSLEVYGVQKVLDDTSLVQNGQITNDHNRILRAFDGPMGLGFEGFDHVDGPMGNAVHNMANTYESSEQINRIYNENGSRARSMECMTITDDQKPKERLVRYASMTSFDPVDEVEVTKKRRGERSRKMAEAKERVSTPNVPSDMQSIVKRCESLEKEVRSLKLNLAFMNRKDSEQIKQLEELQIQHEELTEEKERLLEEIERILIARKHM